MLGRGRGLPHDLKLLYELVSTKELQENDYERSENTND